MTEPPSRDDGFSVATMVNDVAHDVGRLVRQEVELAKTEIRAEVGKAASAGRLIASGALALHLVAVLASVAVALTLGEVLGDRLPELARWVPALAAGGVALLWLIIGLVLLGVGRSRLRTVSPIPRQTIESLKEDIAWIRRPTA